MVSNYRTATVVISQTDAHVLTTTSKWSNWSRTWGTTTPRSCQFHIFTCRFCLLQLVLLFHWRCRRGLPSWRLSSLIKDVTKSMPTRSQSILSKLGKISQELTVENVHVVNDGVRDAWTWKHSEAMGVRGHAPREILKFGPLEWLKMH